MCDKHDIYDYDFIYGDIANFVLIYLKENVKIFLGRYLTFLHFRNKLI